MDATELLAREDEFKRLNKQLEKKTESLMQEIEHVMQKQDFFAVFSPSLSQNHQKLKKHCCTPPTPEPITPVRRPIRKKSMSLEPSSESNSEYEINTQNRTKSSESENHTHNRIKSSEFDNQTHNRIKNKPQNRQRVVCDCCPKGNNDDMEFLYAFVSVNVKDKVLPPSFSKDRVSVESVCKFLSSKIKLMQEQIDKLQSAVDRKGVPWRRLAGGLASAVRDVDTAKAAHLPKASQCEGHLTQLAELESERLSLLNRTNSLKCSTADMKAKVLALQKRLEEKDKQYKEQRSECDRLSSELKRTTSRFCGAEARRSEHQHMLDGLRQQVEQARKTEKDLRESARALTINHQSAISRLESQLKAVTSRAARQAALVDNLRKQNLWLAAEGAVRCLEKDYCNFLNQDL